MTQFVNLSTNRIKEAQLVNELTHYFKSEKYKVRREVPNFCQSVDLVLTRGRWLTLIEVKVHDWRKAIYQCRAHEQVADYVCIVIATLNVSYCAMNEIKSRGYGLLHRQHTGEIIWVLKPKRNSIHWKPLRRKFSTTLREIDYV